jgi:hypothetical protein
VSIQSEVPLIQILSWFGDDVLALASCPVRYILLFDIKQSPSGRLLDVHHLMLMFMSFLNSLIMLSCFLYLCM